MTPKDVGDYQYVIKCILPKCVRWFILRYKLIHVHGTY
jgi:hypothetical protein